MKGLVRIVLVLSVFLGSIHGQASFPRFGSIENDGFTTLNLYNLGYYFQIGMFALPSRGMPFSPTLTYNSFIWQNTSGTWAPVVDNNGAPTWGWQRQGNQFALERPTYTVQRGRCIANDDSNQWSYTYSNFRTSNQFFPSYQITLAELPNDYPECGDSSPALTAYGQDSSGLPNGYLLAITLSGSYGISPAVLAPSGSDLDGSSVLRDTNGNVINESGSTWYDTIGRPALAIGNNVTTHHTTYSYYDASHTLQSVDTTLAAKNITTYFQCSGISEYSVPGVYLPTSIALADGSAYTFSYEASTSPGHTSDTTGRISKITLPTGGYIQYSYSGTNCADGSPSQVTKTINDLSTTQTWTYVRSISGSTWKTVETTPQGNDVVIAYYSDGLPGTTTTYQGSSTLGTPTVLSGVGVTYGTYGPNAISTVVGSNSKNTQFAYDSYGNITSQSEYDWNIFYSPLRYTEYTYNTQAAYISANMLNLPITKKVSQGSTVVSYTEYFYDGLTSTGASDPSAIAMVNRSGASAHDDANYGISSTNPRGNLTRIVEYVSPNGTPSGGLTTLYGYDSTGNLVKSVDPNGNVTAISYADSWSSSSSSCSIGSGGSYAYPTSITQASGSSVSLNSTSVYNKCIGMAMSTTDANTQTSTYDYSDPLLRLTGTRNPDVTTTAWSTQTAYHAYNGSTVLNAFTSTSNLHDGSTTTTSTMKLDGLGRAIRMQGTNGAYIDYGYGVDTANHLTYQSTSNSYFSGPPAFTYVYSDPVGRPVKSIAADAASTTTISYSNNCSTTTDPAGLNRKVCSDPLGRIGSVTEDPNGVGVSPALNYLTTYQYDGLDDLVAVCQGSAFSGATCPSGSLGRSFTYDGLARMISETTPEAGTTTYYYTTSTGSLCSGDRTQLCRKTDALSVTSTYSYDALSRVTGKTYSDSTSAVAYSYGQTSYNGLAIANGLGRRTGMSDGSGNTAWSFDSVGRVAAIRKTINGVTHEADYTSYYDGFPHQLTDFAGTTYLYGYDSSAQLTSISDGSNNYASGATYQPSGQLSTLTHQLTSSSTSYTRSYSSNALLQPSIIQAYPTSSSASPFLKLTYGYSSGTNNGTISSMTDGASGHSGRSQSYTYDNLNRLATAAVGTSWGTQYSYDQFGNLTGEAPLSGVSSGGSWSATPTNNRLSTSGYNAAGEASTVNGTISYTYDAEGRIVTSGTATYVYDGDGFRVKKTGGSTTLYWPGSTGTTIDESDGSATNFGKQVWFGPLLVYNEDVTGHGRFLFQDHLGSTRVRTDISGTVENDLDYEPFGKVLSDYGSSTANAHYNFTGYETDDDLSSYAVYRNLDSVHGRFDRSDPYGGSYDLTNPQSLNRYSYVLNNPMAYTDPFGLREIPWTFSCTWTENWSDGGWRYGGSFLCNFTGGAGAATGGEANGDTGASKAPNNIGCSTKLPNGKTVGQYVQNARAQLQAIADRQNSIAQAGGDISPFSMYTQFASIVKGGGPIDFKTTFSAQAPSGSALHETMGDAGNFAYYAIGAGYIPTKAMDLAAGGYGLYGAAKGRFPRSFLTGRYYADDSARRMRTPGLSAGGC